jgi:aryl-alcohol dehydrogenase-like predicted oxidoreductase
VLTSSTLRQLGNTGIDVTPIGFGAMQIGDPTLPESLVADVLHGVLDAGVALIDTARSYGLAEERIGRHLAARRDEFILSTKVGYGVEGVPDWSYECVARGIDAARDRLRTDVIDIVHLHSCGLDVLQHNGVLDALGHAREQGKIRAAAYSGDGAPLEFALYSGQVQSVQLSLSLCDRAGESSIAVASSRGAGVLVKRSLFGLPWRAAQAPTDPPHAEYFRRYSKLRAYWEPADWQQTALRFSTFATGVACCIVGGINLQHLRSNLAAVARGPLSVTELEEFAAAYQRADEDWQGVV